VQNPFRALLIKVRLTLLSVILAEREFLKPMTRQQNFGVVDYGYDFWVAEGVLQTPSATSVAN
jgi:hypothetical protein